MTLTPEMRSDILAVGRAVLSRLRASAVKTPERYRQFTMYNIHALYSRAMNRINFIQQMSELITQQIKEAFISGAEEVQVPEEDWEPKDFEYLNGIIKNELHYISGLADDVQQAQSDRTGWEQFGSRADIWVARYDDATNRARVYFGGKQRLIWNLGATEEHCDNCARLNGIVAFAEEWEDSGVHPKSPPNSRIECGGWQCDCSLEVTSQRRTRNAYDRIMKAARARL